MSISQLSGKNFSTTRGKLNSTNSEPSKTSKAEKLAYFRANVTSADDEGIVFDTVASGHEGHGKEADRDGNDSSETEGEDLISEMEELSKHGDINPCNGNGKDEEETSVSYKSVKKNLGLSREYTNLLFSE